MTTTQDKKLIKVTVTEAKLPETKEALLIPLMEGQKIPGGVRYIANIILEDSTYLLFERIKK